MEPIIQVDSLSFKYSGAKQTVLKKVTFDVQPGEFYCIIGANGSGKSSLCSALVGLVPHYFSGTIKGSVKINGQDTQDTSVAKLAGKIGFVFQNPFNQLSYTTSTVEEELAYGLCNLGTPLEEMRERVHAIAKTMRVEQLLHKSPLELSGGQVQRVAVGSAMVMQPDILVLDECTTQLDPLGSEEIFDIVKQLNADGITVVMVDHDMERVARCADRVMAMAGGKVLAIDTPEGIFSSLDMEEQGIDIPDFARFSILMRQQGLYNGPVLVTEDLAINAGKAVMGL